MEQQIRDRLEEIRKFLQSDGGDLEVVEINDKNVKLRLVGACGSCPHAVVTLKEGIQKDLRENVDNDIVVTRAE